MFIGGGSAGTAGGIKIATFLVLGYAIWNEVRGNEHVSIVQRSISSPVQRQALSVALLGVAAVVIGTLLLLTFTDHSLEKALFEVISAFGTVGLSTGITAGLPVNAQLVLIVLMFLGRIGTITVSTALALSLRPKLFRLPEERPSSADQSSNFYSSRVRRRRDPSPPVFRRLFPSRSAHGLAGPGNGSGGNTGLVQ